MSRKFTLVDDMDGTEGTERNPVVTQTFALNGQNYEMDLANKNAQRLQEALTPFIIKARQITRVRASALATGDSNSAVREWARAQKNEDGTDRFPDLGDRGRLPEDVAKAYANRNGGDSDSGTGETAAA